MESGMTGHVDPQNHPEAFYQGLRLCGVDGTRLSVTNTPSVKRAMRQARRRRGRAAFAQVGAAVMVELGLHNPIAAALGGAEDSEMVLARQLWPSLPERSLLLIDRYYGVGEVWVGLPSEGQREFLVRGLWQFLALSADLLSPQDIRVVVRRTLSQVADPAITTRRPRSCPRAVRQPLRGWPRLIKNTYAHGESEVTVVTLPIRNS
jgi:hypothetical protein